MGYCRFRVVCTVIPLANNPFSGTKGYLLVGVLCLFSSFQLSLSRLTHTDAAQPLPHKHTRMQCKSNGKR